MWATFALYPFRFRGSLTPKAALARSMGDLRITVWAAPSGSPPQSGRNDQVGGWVPAFPGRSRSNDGFSATDAALAAPSLVPFFPEVQEDLNYVFGSFPTLSLQAGVAWSTLTPSGGVCGCGAKRRHLVGCPCFPPRSTASLGCHDFDVHEEGSDLRLRFVCLHRRSAPVVPTGLAPLSFGGVELTTPRGGSLPSGLPCGNNRTWGFLEAGYPGMEKIARRGTSTPVPPSPRGGPGEGGFAAAAYLRVGDPDSEYVFANIVGTRGEDRFFSSLFEGRAYRYKVLPFGLALSPRVFTKIAEGALSLLWEMDIRILNYLDDWLIIAHSQDLLCEHRDLVLQHLSYLGLQVSWEKSKLSPVQSISFLGMELDSVNMSARLTNSVSKAPGAYGSRSHAARTASFETASALALRPNPEMGMAPRHVPALGQTLRSYGQGVPLGQVSRHVVMNTDASKTGWGAVCNGQAASGSWTGPRLQWHISCLELLAVLLALRRFLPMLRDKHVLIRTDNVPTVAYILTGRVVYAPVACRNSPAISSCGSRRIATPPPDGPANLESIRQSSGGPVRFPGILPLPAVLCPDEAPLGRDALAHSWPQGLTKYAFPPVGLLAQTLCKIREDEEQVLLVAPHWPTRTWFADLQALRDSPSLVGAPEEGPSFSGDGHNLAPASQPLEPTCVASGRDSADLTCLPQAVINTIIQATAPSTRQAYALKWGLFADWCSSHREDPQRCSVGVVLSFLQEKLERRLSPSTLKVYVAAIAAYHDAVDGLSLGKHHLIVRFLRGARRLNPPRPHLIPSWDLSVVLLGLRRAPFEPLASVKLKYLSLKTSLLIALTSIKRVGDLHALLLLCPARALRTYVDRTRSFRHSEQLFVCFGGQQLGNAVSKQRLAHWVVDAITLAYQCHGEPCPLGVRAHSTRSVGSFYALAHGASLADTCRAAGWATPNTFARFYNLRIEPVSSRVLSCSLTRTLGPPGPHSSDWDRVSGLCPVGGSFTPPGCGYFSITSPYSSIFLLSHLTYCQVSPPPNVCFSHLAPRQARFSGLQGVGKRMTEGEYLGYICNPRSLKEGTETLRPLATILDCAGALSFGSAPQLKSERVDARHHPIYPYVRGEWLGMQNPLTKFSLAFSSLFRGDWPPKGDPKYVSYDVTSPFPPSGNEGYRCNRDV
ncbi:ORF V: Enzymatic polyprotein [Labeo rohita]|uniref:ribonuclease H n=1 Tax=Labeo rohita TaxID=84645 RepID=A0ABQ8LY25_LABRO|nr:ORF V: Enzymatic polyprotein [Labeo rohita]